MFQILYIFCICGPPYRWNLDGFEAGPIEQHGVLCIGAWQYKPRHAAELRRVRGGRGMSTLFLSDQP